MKVPAFLRRMIREQLTRRLPEYGYELVYVRGRNPLVVADVIQERLITCNFCGMVFRRAMPDHPESLACQGCDAIARERVVYQCILDELSQRTGEPLLFFRNAPPARQLTLLECSPRYNEQRRKIYEETLGRYLASDYDMLAHRADIKLDLTNDEDVAPFEGSVDIVICAHVLEHIQDYRKALINLQRLLAPGGFMVLQVPLLESRSLLVTWDEFHQDNTRVYHRFGFDLLFDLEQVFSRVKPVVGLLDFEITSPEIKPDKYEILKGMRERVTILGRDRLLYNGLGSPDLCDAFVAYK